MATEGKRSTGAARVGEGVEEETRNNVRRRLGDAPDEGREYYPFVSC